MIAARLTAQLLAGPPARDALEVTGHLLAVQAQDPRGARLAVRARTTGGSAADVDHALSHERTLVVTWLNRGTLHLVRTDDYPWLHKLTTPPLHVASSRRLAQEKITPAQVDRGLAVIERSLRADGPLARSALRDRLASAGVRTEGQALIQLLFAAAIRGICVRGPVIGADQAYVHARDWLGPPAPFQRDQALAELARRYLAGHGPSSDRDLARWAGLPLRDARAGLTAIAAELTQRDDGLVDLVGRRPPAALPPPRLLGAFEPVLLGWRSREPFLGAHEPDVVTGGIFRPFAMIDGVARATWGLAGGSVTIRPFGSLDPEDAAVLQAEAADVVRFFGGPVVRGGAASIAPPGRDSSAGRAHD